MNKFCCSDGGGGSSSDDGSGIGIIISSNCFCSSSNSSSSSSSSSRRPGQPLPCTPFSRPINTSIYMSRPLHVAHIIFNMLQW